MKKFLHWFLFIGFLVFLVLIFYSRANLKLENIKQIKLAGVVLDVELAMTPEARTLGLSGRIELKDNESMLFVFDTMGIYSFWMKDMNFPIDIIWLAPSEGGDWEDMKVVYIKKNATPESFPESFGPDKNAKYVLETVSGFSEKNNLKVGDKVEFTY